jgi:putative transposase
VAAFIAAQGEQHGIPYATACRALQVSPAWFYKWRHGDPSPRHARRIGLAAEVARLFAKHHGKYGSPRITADLRAAGRRVSENTVATLMREQQLVARAPRRRKQTTRQGRGRWRAPDLIGRDFAAGQVNRKWYGDGTEIPTDEGKLFLDSVLDMGSRRIVGFALGEHHDAELAYAALTMAVAVRGGKEAVAGVVFHTDQGSEGGFKWSSQHLERGGARGQTGWVDEGVDGKVGNEVAGSPFAAPGRGASVLAWDRQGSHERGGRNLGRCVAGGRFPLVPGAWRDAFAHPCAGVR